MGTPEALSREKRRAILDGAMRMFAAHGYEGASMSMITAAAGVSKGTIYQHFGGKSALFGAAVVRECEERLTLMLQPLEGGPPAAETLRRVGARFVAMLTHPDVLAIERIVMAEAVRFPELAQGFYAAGPARAMQTMARYLARQAQAGALAIPDADFAAEQFFALCKTRLTLRAQLNLPNDDAEADRVVEGAVRVFMAAYGVEGSAAHT